MHTFQGTMIKFTHRLVSQHEVCLRATYLPCNTVLNEVTHLNTPNNYVFLLFMIKNIDIHSL